MKNKLFNQIPAASLAGAIKDLMSKLLDGTILFYELTAFLKMSKVKRNEIFGITSIISFVAKDLFGHRIEGQVPQWMSDNFQTRIFNLCKDMVVECGNTPELEFHILRKNMNDSAIQKATNSKPMKLGDYLLARKLLIIDGQADKTKYYIFHIELEDKTVRASDLYWYGDEWYSYEYSFDDGSDWHEGYVYVSLKKL